MFSRPVVSADRYFKVLACAGAGRAARLGLAVSRKVDRRASARNRLKRIARESFRRHFGRQAPRIDAVILPRSEAVSATNATLFGSLEKHWNRLANRFETQREPGADASGEASERG